MAMVGASQASRGRRGRRGRGGPMAEINVTPLVDVMLVLLIIFMVTAPLLTAAVPLNLPDSRAQAMAEEPDQVTINMTADGAVHIGDEPVPGGTLTDRLESLATAGGGQPPLVTLRADRALDYGRVMALMGEINRAGFSQISLVTSGSGTAP